MLVVRPEQMEVFSELARTRFEDQMVEHLRAHLPARCRDLDESQIRRAIRHGVARAEARGLRVGRDVCRFIDVMFVFGVHFEIDPRFPWVGGLLQNVSAKTAAARMEAVFDMALENAARGPGLDPRELPVED